MPRRKQLTFKIKDLRCAQYLIAELSQLPQLTNFDMTSIEISIKENKPVPKIIKKDIDVLIDRLQRGFSNAYGKPRCKFCELVPNRCYS